MSYVDTPAVDSVFLKRQDRKELRGMKTKDRHGRQMKSKSMCETVGQGMFLKSELDDKNYVVKAVALIPDVVDGNGEFISKEEIYKASLKFMEHQKVDSQHDFEEGKGDVVFNWILEEDQAMPLMHGGVKEYPKGTWIVGTKVKDPKEWELIKDGTRKGFSIAGFWSGVPMKKPPEGEDPKSPQPTKSQSSSDEEQSIKKVNDMEHEEVAKIVNSVMDAREASKAEKDKEDELLNTLKDLQTRLEKLENPPEEEKVDETLDEPAEEAKEEEEDDDEEEEKEEEEEKAEEDEDEETMEDEEEEDKSIEEEMLEEKQILRRGTKGKKGEKAKKPSTKALISSYKSDLKTGLE